MIIYINNGCNKLENKKNNNKNIWVAHLQEIYINHLLPQ